MISRRGFVRGAVSTAALLRAARFAFGAPAAPPAAEGLLAFDLPRVRLLPGPFFDAAGVNRRFLMNLDPDRLLHTFRVTARIPSSADPLGGWEAPENELRGHYTGHYLSALAMRFAAFGDDEAKSRGGAIVEALAKCQKAHGNGYLSAFPEELFDRLRRDERVWAPFYTLHKILAGMIEMATLAENAQALDVARGMANWTARWTQPLGEAAMARVLEREYGGMNEALYDLAAITGDESLRDVARRFDHERIFAPLAEGRDELKGLHVNTTIPKIVGAARRYELTGERRYRDVAEYFWREVTARRAYCTGGTSNGESWNAAPGVIAGELSGYTQECCPTYNMLKLTRHVAAWAEDAAPAEYAERALWNGILGTQHPADGSKLYYVPLASGYWKLFGTPLHDFWCCTGTGSESFAKVGEQIWSRSGEAAVVDQFIASELDWKEKKLRLVQETRFPETPETNVVVRAAEPVRAEIRLRIPSWTEGRAAGTLNGRPVEGFAAPGSWWSLDRVWRDGDRVSLTLPMRARFEATPDDPSTQAAMVGPIVLAGRLGKEGLTPSTLRAEPTKPRTVPEYKLDPVSAPELRGASLSPGARPLEFRAATIDGRAMELVPLNSLFDERYAVYWKIRSA
ncbi:MAG TPA: glycoside hydrolase family 127 protein [Thermoanaerobaculia bacterium]|nr:glycoside hydrolase family 127 protein [Thermoanaerobaculia bacterium]